MFSTSCCSFSVSDVSAESRRPPNGNFVSSEFNERGGELDAGEAEVTDSGVVATDASFSGLALRRTVQLSVFSILGPSVSWLDCGDSETGEK